MDAEQLNAPPKREVEENSAQGGGLPSQENADDCSENSFSRLKEWHLKLAQDVESYMPCPEVTPKMGVKHSVGLRSTLPDLEMRAEQGSVTARKFLKAYELLLTAAFDAFNGRDSGGVFRNFRAAKKLWDSVPAQLFLEKFGEIAWEALEKNPEDADAMYVMTYAVWWKRFIRGGDYRDVVSMAKRCLSLQPSVPEFHAKLALMYQHEEDHENAVKCFEQALALEVHRDWLFLKGDNLLNVVDRERDAIKDFEQYVEQSEKDDPRLPLACYLVAVGCVMIGDEEKAGKYFKLGEEMETYSITTPYHYWLHSSMRELKANIKRLMEEKPTAEILFIRLNLGESENTEDDGGLKCRECGKTATTLSTCGRCMKTRYCGRECQKKHWPTHKKFCKKK
jgi:tetratricopeptide (TPR) repeat protein